MRKKPQPVERKGLKSTGSDLDRKFWVALALYAILAALAWFTVGEGAILVHGKPVELRLLPLIIIGAWLCARCWPVRRIRFAGTGMGAAVRAPS